MLGKLNHFRWSGVHLPCGLLYDGMYDSWLVLYCAGD